MLFRFGRQRLDFKVNFRAALRFVELLFLCLLCGVRKIWGKSRGGVLWSKLLNSSAKGARALGGFLLTKIVVKRILSVVFLIALGGAFL